MADAEKETIKEKILLIDDDPVFRALAESTALSLGINMCTYESVAEMGSFARIKEFDVALLDFDLEHLNGIEIAEYIDTFFPHIPVILITAHDLSKVAGFNWPSCIKEVQSKSRPFKEILEHIEGYLRRREYLGRFDPNYPKHASYNVAD